MSKTKDTFSIAGDQLSSALDKAWRDAHAMDPMPEAFRAASAAVIFLLTDVARSLNKIANRVDTAAAKAENVTVETT